MPGAGLRCRMVCVTRSTTPSHHSLSIIYTHYIYFEIESCNAIFLSCFRWPNQFSQQLGHWQESWGRVLHVSVLDSCLHWTTRVSPKVAGNTGYANFVRNVDIYRLLIRIFAFRWSALSRDDEKIIFFADENKNRSHLTTDHEEFGNKEFIVTQSKRPKLHWQ